MSYIYTKLLTLIQYEICKCIIYYVRQEINCMEEKADKEEIKMGKKRENKMK